MQLGAFSVSLGVKDLAASRVFYEALGFTAYAGTEEHNYLIMKNGDTLVGLFQGMFEGAMLTFNPGWDQNATNVDPFDDVRAIKAKLAASGVEVTQEQGGEEGPGSFMVTDPDGYPILIDQHR
ncbi:Catechol 2,3-dioxygenase [Aliiroseovarius halocynthiae]|uniref:VOC family protein n=1 Tax=Aliiroseovarius halocynthiae TaxID=985055 RepID=A0A545SSI6_9RHOB|nr:VOC family protein [Aliiroseovarius halocynthiae]TQV67931.1 VOC family protein [Aliiroseovarius halocynthiae]SMR73033.1 Catechol 2,3-dioxygenase [Aliiroseovarius halocynthiae]